MLETLRPCTKQNTHNNDEHPNYRTMYVPRLGPCLPTTTSALVWEAAQHPPPSARALTGGTPDLGPSAGRAGERSEPAHPSEPYFPAGHPTHRGSASASPASQYSPAAHGLHAAASLCCPAATPIEPAGHASQLLSF